jgi:hypothetical protein
MVISALSIVPSFHVMLPMRVTVFFCIELLPWTSFAHSVTPSGLSHLVSFCLLSLFIRDCPTSTTKTSLRQRTKTKRFLYTPQLPYQSRTQEQETMQGEQTGTAQVGEQERNDFADQRNRL